MQNDPVKIPDPSDPFGGRSILLPKRTNPPALEHDDWEASLVEGRSIIKGKIWDSRNRLLPNDEKES